MATDEQLLSHLRDLSGDDADVWKDFEPTSWRAFLPEGEEEEESAGESAPPGAVLSPLKDGDGDYASDDSAEMILNFHKLTPAEKASQGGGRGGSCKLSKARQFASEEVAFPREVAELERVEWKETGLGMGDRSAESEFFVPWRLIENYPDMFVGKANGVRVRDL
jgi:hypothetical protein